MPELRTVIGPHLLGRHYVEDKRDWKVAQLHRMLDCQSQFAAGASIAELRQVAGEQPPEWWVALWQLLSTLFPAIKPGPGPIPPTPPQPAPTDDKVWSDPDAALDQGNTPHCVGFGCAQFGNCDPVNDHWGNSDGHAIYYEAKVIDGEPRQENGSSVRSGAIALRNRGRIAAFAAASNVDEIVQWLQTKGPVVVGTNWTSGMFKPDQSGVIKPTGQVQGGHCWILKAVWPADNMLGGLNSWSPAWGLNGEMKIALRDFAKLFAAQGDAILALEMPKAAIRVARAA